MIDGIKRGVQVRTTLIRPAGIEPVTFVIGNELQHSETRKNSRYCGRAFEPEIENVSKALLILK